MLEASLDKAICCINWLRMGKINMDYKQGTPSSADLVSLL